MKKRMVCAVLCCALLALCWGGLPAGAATGERTGPTADGLCYTLTMGRAVITGCEQPAELYDLAVPALIEGYPVTAIGYGAFRGCENLQTVTLPEGLTTLQAEAFAGCAALQTVSLPRSLTVIQERAFAHNAALTDMPLPAMEEHFTPAGITWSPFEGGLFAWCRLPEGVDMLDFVKKGMERKVAVVPGTAFLTDDTQPCRAFRINFSTPTDEQLTEGVGKLGELCREMKP